jgi:hypothetical protein
MSHELRKKAREMACRSKTRRGPRAEDCEYYAYEAATRKEPQP